jgi:hypothetical protein
MEKGGTLGIGAILALIGGFATLMYSFYYIQQLSLNLGAYYGIQGTITAFHLNATNVTVSKYLLLVQGQTSTLAIALHLSYVLVPFAVLIFAIGVLWLFSKAYSKTMAMIMAFASIVYLIIAAVLQLDFFSFPSTHLILPGSYVAGALALIASSYVLIKSASKTSARRPAQQISIDPDTPYSNMKILSNKLMKKLSGEIRILDMHFDVNALDNLIQLTQGNLGQYKSISVLAKRDRLTPEFEKRYKDFKSELENKGITFELRVLSEKDASKQHERMLIDESSAYKIPPLNIINRKSEHIVSIKQADAVHRFVDMWAEATKFENFKSTEHNLQ